MLCNREQECRLESHPEVTDKLHQKSKQQDIAKITSCLLMVVASFLMESKVEEKSEV